MALLAGRLAALNRRGPREPCPLRYLAIGLGGGLLMVSGESQLALINNKPPQLFGLLSCCALFLGMAILLLAATPVRPPEAVRRLAARLRLPLVTLAVLLATLWVLYFVGTTYSAFAQPPKDAYYNDVISFSHVGAELVLAGQNPYTSDAEFRTALQSFPHALPSPLRGPLFSKTYDYPHYPLVASVTKRYAAGDPSVQQAFDPATLHSYPALSFLIYVPLFWLGLPNTMALNALVLISLLVAAAWGTPRSLRFGVWATLLASSFLIFYTLGGSFEAVAFLPALLAWRWRERRVLSPVCWERPAR